MDVFEHMLCSLVRETALKYNICSGCDYHIKSRLEISCKFPDHGARHVCCSALISCERSRTIGPECQPGFLRPTTAAATAVARQQPGLLSTAPGSIACRKTCSVQGPCPVGPAEFDPTSKRVRVDSLWILLAPVCADLAMVTTSPGFR